MADVAVKKDHCCLAHKAELLSVFLGRIKLSGISQTKIHEVTLGSKETDNNSIHFIDLVCKIMW